MLRFEGRRRRTFLVGYRIGVAGLEGRTAASVREPLDSPLPDSEQPAGQKHENNQPSGQNSTRYSLAARSRSVEVPFTALVARHDGLL